MSMHLLSPAYTTTKYSKRKAKYWTSSEAKKKSEMLEASWKELLKKYPMKKVAMKVAPLIFDAKFVDEKRSTKNIPSKDSGGFAAKKDLQVYTGDKMLGIAAMHKSNLVPIFSDDSAKEVARMRRG